MNIHGLKFELDEEFRQRNRKHTKEERQNLALLIEIEGCKADALTVAQIDTKLLLCDGYTTLAICEEKGIKPTAPRVLPFKSREDVLEWIDRVQEGRRNLTAEEMAKRREARIKRVVEARKQGDSTRTIAAAEGVSQRTILDDLQLATNQVDLTDGGYSVQPTSGVVNSRDGVQRPAIAGKKPLCSRCARKIRIGQEAVKGCDMCKQLRPGATPKPIKQKDALYDSFGVEIPKSCRDAWADPWIQTTIDYLGTLIAEFWKRKLADGLTKRKGHYPFINAKDFGDSYAQAGHFIDQILEHLKENRPAGVCPACGGEKCPKCKMSGLVPKALHKELKAKK